MTEKKVIRKYIWEEFDIHCQYIANKIKKANLELKGIYGIPRGGLVLAVTLSHKLGVPLILTNPINCIKKEEILICDDISDTGNTLEIYKKRGYKIATIYFKKGSKVRPDFFTMYLTANWWIQFPWENDNGLS